MSLATLGSAGGRTAFVVAAGRLLPLGLDHFEPKVVEVDIIHVIARLIVSPDRDHDGVIVGGPGDEHPVIAIEMSGAEPFVNFDEEED